MASRPRRRLDETPRKSRTAYVPRRLESIGGVAYEGTDRIRGFDRYESAEIPGSFDDDPAVVAVFGETVVVRAVNACSERS